MGSEHYCLRWNNHQNNLLGVFSQLLQEESLVDVTLACSEEGRLIRAHKVVLSACSAYFKALFLDHPTRHPIVVLKDVQFAELRDLVEFMYRGEVNVDHRQLSTLLKTAESLKVKGLADMARPSDAADDSVSDHVEMVSADRDDDEPEDLRPMSRCRTPEVGSRTPEVKSRTPVLESRTPSPPPTESDDNLSMQSEPSDMTTVDRQERLSSPPSFGLPPVQQVPLFLKKEAECDKTDDRSAQGESSLDYRNIPDPDRDKPDATLPRFFTCVYCDLTFPHQSKLTRHILSHSLENLPPPALPPQAAGSGGLLSGDPGGGGEGPSTLAHLVDDGVGALCKFCGKPFPDVASLVGHLPAHTGDRPFKCEFCGKAFKLRHHMKDHCRVHTGERPFRCSLCGKTFSRSTILKAHEKTHYPKFTGRHRFVSSPSPEEEPGGHSSSAVPVRPFDLSVIHQHRPDRTSPSLSPP